MLSGVILVLLEGWGIYVGVLLLVGVYTETEGSCSMGFNSEHPEGIRIYVLCIWWPLHSLALFGKRQFFLCIPSHDQMPEV